ncbi:MAG: hypothetical protein A2268_13835 [Candidatus Raymondbacteria bacterium RifOxyA12_full_50_37]|uniref:Outer membrane protein beta-barrel domain-containing protein n=1 Tax=Candidatus Raymondbacteria bacterium RIFOXYD12_FULL_49_13 TaxID=1817890 RepID=A0A1F7F4N3_UNCRA|nr:MAG: hypothetical protein A2248_00765 [Candidatus Raymondbacteria bacterium RIFOXYA2_FULL_49_16]OGJ91923.1 MAG: hypothetical protein A2268_13835 [Candidatus Raymondbacteria bacterium RifOxyA12_full_50_37]OGJ92838.1 MAG: hypothetical protein A2487_09705 [Candidatus Raymondbacteria bacterium RifOxyC12_full_50_8]OGJ95469.1 MAG: hypothetical protein A2453_05270 [Candidatus Raymondbacteria bacterium RIFOXYC2_FULL_50_21]OGK01625.1 MAG: hypothetical protein A2519_07275 [Candidatus Raymondbacteria b
MFKPLLPLVCIWIVFIGAAAFLQAEGVRDSTSSHEGPAVGDISNKEETQIARRITAKKYMALGLGPAGLWGVSSNRVAYLFHYAHYWEVAPWAAIKFKSDNVFNFSAPAFFLAATIGSNFYLTRTNISPFLGFDFGLALAKKPDFDAAFGFAAGGSAGIAFFRTSSAQLMLDLNVQTLLRTVDAGNPGKYSLGISVLF